MKAATLQAEAQKKKGMAAWGSTAAGVKTAAEILRFAKALEARRKEEALAAAAAAERAEAERAEAERAKGKEVWSSAKGGVRLAGQIARLAKMAREAAEELAMEANPNP